MLTNPGSRSGDAVQDPAIISDAIPPPSGPLTNADAMPQYQLSPHVTSSAILSDNISYAREAHPLESGIPPSFPFVAPERQTSPFQFIFPAPHLHPVAVSSADHGQPQTIHPNAVAVDAPISGKYSIRGVAHGTSSLRTSYPPDDISLSVPTGSALELGAPDHVNTRCHPMGNGDPREIHERDASQLETGPVAVPFGAPATTIDLNRHPEYPQSIEPPTSVSTGVLRRSSFEHVYSRFLDGNLNISPELLISTGLPDVDAKLKEPDFFISPEPGLEVLELMRLMRDEQNARVRRAELAIRSASLLADVWKDELHRAKLDREVARERIITVRHILSRRGIVLDLERISNRSPSVGSDFGSDELGDRDMDMFEW